MISYLFHSRQKALTYLNILRSQVSRTVKLFIMVAVYASFNVGSKHAKIWSRSTQRITAEFYVHVAKIKSKAVTR